MYIHVRVKKIVSYHPVGRLDVRNIPGLQALSDKTSRLLKHFTQVERRGNVPVQGRIEPVGLVELI
jgi:hypothetical protein